MQGRLGLELAREHRPDLVLLDLHLPDIAGDEVLAGCGPTRPRATIPVVILTRRRHRRPGASPAAQPGRAPT